MSPIRRAPTLPVAVAYGVGSAVTVYAVVVLLLAVQLLTMADVTGGTTATAFLSGTLGDFYAAHLGATDVTPGVRGVDTIPDAGYALVPPVVLAWAGWQTAHVAENPSPRTAARRGAGIAVGYLPAVACTLAVLAVGFEGPVTGVSPGRALLVAGVAFPLVWGGLGGTLAVIVGDEKS